MDQMPNFILAGAARCGTTSIDRYLSQHPEIFMTPWKEGHYFAAEEMPASFTGEGDYRLNRLIIRSPGQYYQLFANVTTQKAIGESSVFYLCYPGVAERIAQAVPDMKIILMLRDPVERSYSAFGHLLRDGRERATFADGLSQEEERRGQGFEPMWWYTGASHYYEQVKRYLDVFGQEQVKVILYEQMVSDPAKTMSEIFRFLGVDPDVRIDTSIRYNAGGTPKMRRVYSAIDHIVARPGPVVAYLKTLIPRSTRMDMVNRAMSRLVEQTPMHPLVRERLETSFAGEVERLESLLHVDLSGWKHQQVNVNSQL